MTSAAAPSEMELEFAGVTVPSFLKAGLSVGIFSIWAFGGCEHESKLIGIPKMVVAWPATLLHSVLVGTACDHRGSGCSLS